MFHFINVNLDKLSEAESELYLTVGNVPHRHIKQFLQEFHGHSVHLFLILAINLTPEH